jgi:hypothetical protein
MRMKLAGLLVAALATSAIAQGTVPTFTHVVAGKS